MLKTSYTRILGALVIAAALLAGCETTTAPATPDTSATSESVPTQAQSDDGQPTPYPPPETPTAYPTP